MGKHRSRAERIEQMCADMRVLQARKTLAEKLARVAPKAQDQVTGDSCGVVEFTYGKPLPRLSRLEVKRAYRAHRKQKRGPTR